MAIVPTSNLQNALNVLRHTYPGWIIEHSRSGQWIAVRCISPTRAQAEAGLHQAIIQPTMQAFAAVLAQQLAIAQDVA